MTVRRIVIWTVAAVILGALSVTLIVRARHASVTLTGVVLRQDPDPRKQLAISNVNITAAEGERTAAGQSDGTGLFRLQLPDGGWRGRPVTLSFRHPGYAPTEIAAPMNGQLDLVRMTPIAAPSAVPVSLHEVAVTDVRVRYAEQTSSTVNVGSTAKTFTVPNVGNVLCADKPPCSPDGKWKATLGGVTLDAGQGQQFENARVSCIAGPCPFTNIESGALPRPGRTIMLRVRNWSSTATFLVEAEVTREMPSDAIRQAYPAIYGRSMSFTLPATAEGPSLQADLDRAEIVFPLGPGLRLSWAECSLQVGADQTKLYRCELKPGYEFR